MEENRTVWPIEKLRLWDKNPRSITKDGFERLKKQIQRFGQYKPLLITGDGEVLGGNMRFRAFQDLGIKEVWVSVVTPKSEAEKIEYALSDNDRVGFYNDDDLANLTSAFPEVDWNLYSIDLREATNLGDLLDQFTPTVQDEPPPVDESHIASKPGEVYKLGKHRLMCADATSLEAVQRLMNGQVASMVFTDPPYNVGYTGGMHADGTQSSRVPIANDKMSEEKFEQFLYDACLGMTAYTKGAFYICMSSSELHTLYKAFTDADGHWQTYIIWAKDAFTLSRSDYQHQFEPVMYGLSGDQVKAMESGEDYESLPILYGWTKHNWYGGRRQGDVWHIERPKASPDHPTMKPIALCAKAIKNSSKPEEIVLDVFGGSGSTLIACEQLNRKCNMMELEPKYCDVIRKRYAKFIGKEAEWQTLTSNL